jgi:broad specificity phosphatase PhoE/ribonuclease HI
VSEGGRRVVVEADGGSRGNPGPAGYGAVVRDAETGEVLAEVAGGIGTATNNVAEYQGLLAGLRAAADLRPAAVDVRMDSKLVVEQMSGRWRIKHPDLAPLAAEAAALVRSLPAVRFGWIPRESNGHADRLANEAMDAAAAGRQWSPGGAARSPRARSRGKSTMDGTGAGATAAGAAVAGAAVAGAAGNTAVPGWGAPAGEPVTMLLLRHGQTEHSVDRRFSGRADPPLTGLGLAQAEAAARRLAAWPGAQISAVVSSPLSRARVTAAAVAAGLGLDQVVDGGLVETDFGAWDGMTFAEVQQRWPAELAAWLGSPEVAPPGGESFADVQVRIRRARDRVLAGYPGRTVVLVSHVTPIKLLLRQALDAAPAMLYRLHLDIAGLSVVDWYPDGAAVVRLVNDTSHLAAVAVP